MFSGVIERENTLELVLKMLKVFMYLYEMLCTIWHHLYNLKNVKNAHGEVSLLIKLQVLTCNFAESNTPPWVFLTFFK